MNKQSAKVDRGVWQSNAHKYGQLLASSKRQSCYPLLAKSSRRSGRTCRVHHLHAVVFLTDKFFSDDDHDAAASRLKKQKDCGLWCLHPPIQLQCGML